jgi:hypothetical protein
MTSSPDISVSLSPPFLGAPGEWGHSQQNRASPRRILPPAASNAPKKGSFRAFWSRFRANHLSVAVVFRVPRKHNRTPITTTVASAKAVMRGVLHDR